MNNQPQPFKLIASIKSILSYPQNRPTDLQMKVQKLRALRLELEKIQQEESKKYNTRAS